MDSSTVSKNCQGDEKWIRMEDVHTVMESRPPYKDIVFSDGKTKLLDCISSMENPKSLDSFLQNLADINTALPSDSPVWPGCTLLHLAVMFSENIKTEYKAASFVKQFLDQEASVQVQNLCGQTPLHLAFHLELEHIVATLIWNLGDKKSEEFVNLLDNENLSYLHIACTSSDHRNSFARKLLSSKQDLKSTINIAYKGKNLANVKTGWTPLHVAVNQFEVSLVELLLQRGASTACKDAQGYTPVFQLFGTNIEADGTKSLARLLFASEELNESSAKGSGLTRLHVAVWYDDAKAAEHLLDLGANIEATVDELEGRDLKMFIGCSPLQVALIGSRNRATKVLLQRGADILKKYHNGTTPLSKALTGNHKVIADMFLKTIWSDENLQRRLAEELGLTPLHIACYSRDVDRVEALLKRGANVNARLHDTANFWMGYTTIHVLIANSDKHWFASNTSYILQKLIQNSCDIDRQDTTGKTALHLMLALKDCLFNYSSVHLFLLAGADISIVDGNGKTAISYALKLYSNFNGPYQIDHINCIVAELLVYMYMMKFVGIDVSVFDETLALAELQKHNGRLDFPRESEFCDQVRATKSIKIGQRGLTLRSFLYETYAISMYPSLTPEDRNEVTAFFQSFDYRSFPDLSPLIKLQFRKAKARPSLIDPARGALKTFVCSNFPDLCADIILKYLSNSQLKNLIAASTDATVLGVHVD